MKKIVVLFSLVLFAFSIFSCNNKESALNNESLSGDITSEKNATINEDNMIYDLAEGMTLPNVKVDTNKGNVFDLDKITKPALINFWATWCPPCRMEMPGLQNLYEKYGDKVDFVMINAGETKETIQDFLVENEIYSFPIGYDVEDSYAMKFGIMGIPTTYLVGTDKIIKNYIIGARSEEQFEEYIKNLINN